VTALFVIVSVLSFGAGYSVADLKWQKRRSAAPKQVNIRPAPGEPNVWRLLP
jgi:hypothetical protein